MPVYEAWLVNDKAREVRRTFLVEHDTEVQAVAHLMAVVKYRNPPVLVLPYDNRIFDPARTTVVDVRILEL